MAEAAAADVVCGGGGCGGVRRGRGGDTATRATP